MNATEKETLRPSTKATQRELASAMNVHFQQLERIVQRIFCAF